MALEHVQDPAMIHIDREVCTACGLCIAVCPVGIPYQVPEQAEPVRVEIHSDRLHICMKCGHCMAICPPRSIHVEGVSYTEHLFDLPSGKLDEEGFFDLLATRRSVRVFKDTQVPGEVLQRIVDAISLAPMGFPPHKVEVTILQKREVVERALPLMVKLYENLERWVRNPLTRLVIRWRAGQEAFDTLCNHVLPSLKLRLPDMKAGKGDTLTRGAPSMLLFHAYRKAEGRTADGWIALTYGLLAAHALGLGATAISLVPPVVERSPELRRIFEIPPENEVLASMAVGYPRYRFGRGIQRKLANVSWI
jgi:nitroreductase/ferredoxin